MALDNNPATIKWLDLSEYGLRLAVIPVPLGDKTQNFLALASSDTSRPSAHLDRAGKALGYSKIQRDSGTFYLRKDRSAFTLQPIFEALKKSGFDLSAKNVVEMPRADVILNPPKPAAPAPAPAPAPKAEAPQAEEPEAKAQETSGTDEGLSPTNVPSVPKAEAPKRDDAPGLAFGDDAPEEEQKPLDPMEDPDYIESISKIIGYNANQYAVREFAVGDDLAGKRFIMNKFAGRATLTMEDEMRNTASVLRVTDDASFKDCVGFMGAQIYEGKTIRPSDLAEFAELIFGEGYSAADYDRLVSGLDNYFSAWLRKAAAENVSLNDIYARATKIQENAAYHPIDNKSDEGIADINMPVAVILHRIAAGLATEDAKVTFVNPGHGALLAKWKKLGLSAEMKIFEAREGAAETINNYRTELGLRRTERALQDKPDYTDRDAIIANVETGWLDSVQERHGVKFKRKEFVEILDALEARKADGNAIFAMPMNGGDATEAEYKQFLEILGRNYAVEGIADVDSTVHAGVAGGHKLALISVSDRRPEPLPEAPEPSMRRREIFDSKTLYTWSAEVIKSRKKIADYLTSMDEQDAASNEGKGVERNDYQAPYIAASKIGEAETMVPKHLEGPQRKAMDRLLKVHPDIDQYVAGQVGMTVEQLAEHASPEQVDCIALEAFAEERGMRGFHIGDATGIGKGRENAFIAGRHLDLDRMPVMMTKASANIDDILRDLGDSGMLPKCRPLILNGGTYTYTDQRTGETHTFEGMSREKFLEMFTVEEPVLDDEGNPVLERVFVPQQRQAQDKDGNPIFDAKGNPKMENVQRQARDENDEPLFHTNGRPKMENVMVEADGEPLTIPRLQIPDDFPFNMIIASYSQVSGDLEKKREKEAEKEKAAMENRERYKPDLSTLKLGLFDELIDESCVMFLDEAQQATGKGNTAKNMRTAISKACRTIFSSATHAKDAATLGLYNILFPETLNEDAIFDIMMKGGENAQEVATAMLAENGVFLRREHDNSRLQFEVVADTERFERNRQVADAISPILAEIAYLSGDLNRRIMGRVAYEEARLAETERQLDELREANPEGGARNPQVRAQRRAIRQQRDMVASLRSSQISFGSPLYRIMKNVTSAMKADKIAEDVIEDLRAGRKPIVMADSTMGDLLKTLYDAQRDAGEDSAPPASLKDFVQREVRGVFKKLEEQMAAREARIAAGEPEPPEFDEHGRPTDSYIDPALVAQYRSIQEMVEALPDFPISMIDEVKRQVREAGFTIDEITGRSVMHDGNGFVPRASRSASAIMNDFNNGGTQALIANQAGLVGLSAHDAPWFINQGQRIMREGDTPANIEIHVQGFGRVLRKGSQTDPKIVSYLSGIPAELRNLASRNKKMRSLNANVSSNRDSASLMENIPDILNSVGGTVLARYFGERQDLLQVMGFDENFAEDGIDTDGYTASRILARMMLFPVALQEEMFNDIQAEFEATIVELNEKNENPLVPSTLPGRVVVDQKRIFEGAPAELILDAFEAPVYLERAFLESDEKGYDGDRIDEMVSEAMRKGDGRFADQQADKIQRESRKRLEALFEKEGAAFPSLDAAIEAGNNSIANKAARYKLHEEMCRKLKPGAQISCEDYFGNPVTGIVVEVNHPFTSTGVMSEAGYTIDYVVPGDARARMTSFRSLMEDTTFRPVNEETNERGPMQLWDGLNSKEDEVLDEIFASFDANSKVLKRQAIELLTGNTFRALQIALENGKIGKMCNYVDAEDGLVKRGVLLKDKNQLQLADFIPLSLRTPEMVFDALRENEEIELHPDQERKNSSLRIKKKPEGYEINLPTLRNAVYGRIYQSPEVRAVYDSVRRNFSKNQQVKVTMTDETELLNFLREVMNTHNITFWGSPFLRDWGNNWLERKNYAENGQDEMEHANSVDAPTIAKAG